MSEPTTTESARREPGVVEALARDDVERKKFLTMAGRNIGAGAAATGLAAFIAACGSSSSSSSPSQPAAELEFDRGGRDVDEQFEQRDRTRAISRSSTTR